MSLGERRGGNSGAGGLSPPGAVGESRGWEGRREGRGRAPPPAPSPGAADLLGAAGRSPAAPAAVLAPGRDQGSALGAAGELCSSQVLGSASGPGSPAGAEGAGDRSSRELRLLAGSTGVAWLVRWV